MFRGECIGQRTMQQQIHRKPDVAGEALWRFSLALYTRPGVAEALIALQDRAGCDVNLLLFALWCGAAHGHRLDRAELAVAEAAIAPVARDIVGPVRQLRRDLKTAPAADLLDLRRRLLALELAAERRVQYRLAATASASLSDADRGEAAEANLALTLGAEAQSQEAAVLRWALAALTRRG
jgi:uncharacterized protein (TIGR02444 family)